jgi:hypothetical protein
MRVGVEVGINWQVTVRRRTDMRLEAQHSALNAGIVNNQRKLMWRFRCTCATRLRDGPTEHASCPNS